MKYALILCLAACGGGGKKSDDHARPAVGPSREVALASFEVVRSVLQSPRCQNCHPAGDAPLQGEEGRVHAMNVQRGPEGKGRVGETCTTCHGPANPPSNYGAHIPPGVEDGWRMPKPEEKLVFVGVPAGELCRRLIDPAHNGGKDKAALRAHLDTPLVTWGWNPGFGRAPVAVPREKFLAAWQTWSDGDMPCPE